MLRSNVRRLTNHGSYDGTPVWSPDGQKIAFVSLRDGYYQIYTVGVNGAGLQRLATGMHSLYAAWSPDGEKIAFSADSDGNGWLELWLMDADGSNPRKVKDPGAQSEIWPHSWIEEFEFPGHISGTLIQFVAYSGNWYWSEAHLRSWNEQGNMMDLSSTGRLSWNPDSASIDIEPPTLAPFGLPSFAYRYIPETTVPQLGDTGGSGLATVEVQRQTYPGGNWVDSYGVDGNQFSSQPPTGGTYVYRLRAWDRANNRSQWVYTSPVTVYYGSLSSTVTDNRGHPLYGVNMVTDPPAFLTIERKGHYTGYLAADGYELAAQWQLEGYQTAPPTYFNRNEDNNASVLFMLAPGNNLIANGGFESGDLSGWHANDPGSFIIADFESHSGRYGLIADYDFTSAFTISISQTVTLPADILHPTLSFHYIIYTPQGPTQSRFEVEITDGQDTELLFSRATATAGWQHQWEELSAWAGKTVTITFRRTELVDEMLTISLDDISLGSTSPDLWLRSSGALAALPGETVTRTLSFGNRGGVSAPDTAVTLTLPNELTLVMAEPAPLGDNPYSWDLGEVAADESGSITLALAMDGDATMGQTARAQATVTTPYEATVANNEIELEFYIGHKMLMPFFTYANRD